jgi:cytoskeletal protein RodZ
MFEIGPALRQARERRHLGLDQAESDTKVRARYLRALEEEDFDLIPGPTYVKGFLRTYAEYLGLDGRLFVEEYACRFLDPDQEDELLFPRRRSLPPRRRRSKRETDLILVVLAAIVALTVIVMIGWRYSEEQPRSPEVPPPSRAATTPLVNPLIEGAEQAKKRTQEAQRATVPTKPVRVVAQAIGGPCWVSVWDGRNTAGAPVYVATLDPVAAGGGKSGVLRSRKGFTVRLGAAGRLRLVVNGKNQTLGSGTVFYVAPSGKVSPA